MSTPRVSICIPTYDRPAGLKVAIESVLAQSFEDVEIIVSDNHESGRSVVDDLGNSKIRYFCNGRNVGAALNAQLALDRASAELVGILHDDDRLLPGYLDRVVTALETEATLGVAFTDHYLEDGSRLFRRNCRLPAGTYAEFLQPMLEHLPVAISSALMRRDVWQATRPLPDLLTMDYVIFIRAACAGWPFRYIDEPLMAYGVHPNQLTNGSTRLRNDTVALWELFEFADARCEALRRRRLASALVNRAPALIHENAFAQAKSDLDRAASLDRSALGVTGRLVRTSVAHAHVAKLTRRALRVRQRLLATRHGASGHQ